jgi:hypothetical protein
MFAMLERAANDTHLRASHGPSISLAEEGVCQEGGKVANGRVLDGGGILPQIGLVPVHRN